MRTEIRELVVTVVAWLFFHIFKMHASLVYADRSSCFHSFCSYTPTGNTLCEIMNGRFGTTASFNHLAAYVHQSVKECAGCDDCSLCVYVNAPDGSYANCFAVFYEKFIGLVLPDIEVRGEVEFLAPLPYEFTAITLCSRAPHSRSFAYIEHTELNGCSIGNFSHLTA